MSGDFGMRVWQRFIGASVLTLGLSLGVLADQVIEQPLTESTMIRFVSAERGRALIAEEDAFVRTLRPLERQIRLQSAKPVTKELYVQSLQAGVREWSSEDISSVSQSIQELREKFKAYELQLPANINLVRVIAEVEANAPHCRAASIILPDRFFAESEKMSQTLAHELFHVMSSHHPELRDRLYAILGFTPCNEIEWPEQLKGRRLTNPDAPIHRHRIELEMAGRDDKISVVPITLCKSAESLPGGLFQNLDFKLLQLEETGGRWLPMVVNGELQLLSPRQAPDYLRRIGRNTGYIIHPEEVLADNFALLVFEASGAPDPWILDELAAIFKK